MNQVKVVLEHKPGFQFRQAEVEKMVRLAEEEFLNFLQNPLADQAFIRENAGLMRIDENGVYHCLLVTGENRRDGVLVEAEGYDYARYASYVPDAAALAYDSLSEMGYRLAYLADMLVQEGTEASEEYWEAGFEDIWEQSGLELGKNEYLRELIADMIAERREVAEVCICEDCFRMQFRPELLPDSRGMEYEVFAGELYAIRPDSRKAAAVWFEWAREMAGYDKGGEPERKGRTAEEFMGELAGCFRTIREKHGDEIAGKMISLAEIHSCIFPWEMKQAAEHLAAGGSIHEILPLSKEGLLEDFSDRGQRETPVQSM